MLTEEPEFAFSFVQLIEADFSFDSNSRSSVAEVWIAGRYYRKSLAFRLPGKVQDSICGYCVTMSTLLEYYLKETIYAYL